MLTKPAYLRFATLTLCILVALSVLAAALPQPAQAAASPAVCAKTHVVKEGETIRRIANTYSMSVYRLAKANNLSSPYPLTAGQSLCIPEDPKLSSNFKWTATYTNDKVRIDGTGFKKQYPFVVRVRENDTSAWYKLGSAQSDRDGELSVSFNTPKDLQKKASIRVCLKDAGTDALVCKQVYRR